MRDGSHPYAIGGHPWPGLSKLIEECGEVLQVAGKIIATGGDPDHWDGSDLTERLGEELADLQAAIEVVVAFNRERLDWQGIARRAALKRRQFEDWHDEQVAPTLERCVCGEHRDCPDGWHRGDDLPCSCTPDCALDQDSAS